MLCSGTENENLLSFPLAWLRYVNKHIWIVKWRIAVLNNFIIFTSPDLTQATSSGQDLFTYRRKALPVDGNR